MFKLGDKVFVDPEANFNVYPHLDTDRLEDSDMGQYVGRETVIIAIIHNHNGRAGICYLEIDDGVYSWSLGWLKKVEGAEELLTKKEFKRLKKLNPCLR